MHKNSFARYVCKENKQRHKKSQVDLIVVSEATSRASLFSVRMVTGDALQARGGVAFDAMKTVSASVLQSQSRGRHRRDLRQSRWRNNVQNSSCRKPPEELEW